MGGKVQEMIWITENVLIVEKKYKYIIMKTKLGIISVMLILFMFGCNKNSSNSVLGSKNNVITEGRIKADLLGHRFEKGGWSFYIELPSEITNLKITKEKDYWGTAKEVWVDIKIFKNFGNRSKEFYLRPVMVYVLNTHNKWELKHIKKR